MPDQLPWSELLGTGGSLIILSFVVIKVLDFLSKQQENLATRDERFTNSLQRIASDHHDSLEVMTKDHHADNLALTKAITENTSAINTLTDLHVGRGKTTIKEFRHE